MIRRSLSDFGYLPEGELLAGRYEILHEIGRGGYSVVYAARDRELGSTVAVKLLVPPPADANIARERMRREVQAVRGLSHANIVAVHDLLEEGPWTFIVMEYVPGPDLSVRLSEGGPLAVDEVVRIGQGIAAALSVAHRRGIVHRDVKPQNVLLDLDGQARLTDFGSAKLQGQVSLTLTGGLVGTLNYTAPEIIAGRRADARSDIFSLGRTLYFALTQRLPELGATAQPGSRSEGHHPRAVRPDVPEWLDRVIARSTAPSPGDRYPTATSFREALERGDGDAETASDPLPADLASCLLCGAPEPLGLGVCPRCGGTSEHVADTLLFVRRPLPQRERRALGIRLQGLLGAWAAAVDVAAVAAGYRALVRIPGAAVERVTEQLSRRQIPTRAVRRRRAWAPLPMPFYGLLGAVLAVGGASEMAAFSSVLFSPLVAALMLLIAQRRLTCPVVSAAGRVAALPMGVEKKVVETFERLPEGGARSILSDLVRVGQGLYTPARRSDPDGLMEQRLSELLIQSCDAACDLADLDDNLARMEAQRDRFPGRSGVWLDKLTRCESARDRLMQRLLEITAVLGEARSHSSELLNGGRRGLERLSEEIEAHFEAHAYAAREIDRVLGTASLAEPVP